MGFREIAAHYIDLPPKAHVKPPSNTTYLEATYVYSRLRLLLDYFQTCFRYLKIFASQDIGSSAQVRRRSMDFSPIDADQLILLKVNPGINCRFLLIPLSSEEGLPVNG